MRPSPASGGHPSARPAGEMEEGLGPLAQGRPAPPPTPRSQTGCRGRCHVAPLLLPPGPLPSVLRLLPGCSSAAPPCGCPCSVLLVALLPLPSPPGPPCPALWLHAPGSVILSPLPPPLASALCPLDSPGLRDQNQCFLFPQTHASPCPPPHCGNSILLPEPGVTWAAHCPLRPPTPPHGHTSPDPQLSGMTGRDPGVSILGREEAGASLSDRPEGTLYSQLSISLKKTTRISREIWSALFSLLLVIALFAELLPDVVEPSNPTVDFVVCLMCSSWTHLRVSCSFSKQIFAWNPLLLSSAPGSSVAEGDAIPCTVSSQGRAKARMVGAPSTETQTPPHKPNQHGGDAVPWGRGACPTTAQAELP